MISAIDSTTGSYTASAIRRSRGLTLNIDAEGNGSFTPEKTEAEKAQEGINALPMQRTLTEEEKEELENYKTLLAQLLASADNPPTEKQQRDIREIEKKIENLTGVKMSKSMSQTMKKLPGTEKEDEQEKEKKAMLLSEPEYLRQMRLNEIGLLEGSKESEGGKMAQFLQGWAQNSYLTSSLSEASATDSILKDVKA
ncbi:hypothetical protein [Salidesulfovibrio onnuriiensis]|uniref:hypothetical protein n=1 Tax=Salidesulfovibrio onnuriiensis TaxID=2583823 RepID=UPI0011C745A5|nr:hypothetical protein [Salidesulfovibrio onnuriiensis]